MMMMTMTTTMKCRCEEEHGGVWAAAFPDCLRGCWARRRRRRRRRRRKWSS